MTIDQVYSMVVQSARDITDNTKRQAFLQKARMHHYQHEMTALQKMLTTAGQGLFGQGMCGQGMYGAGYNPKKVVQRKFMEVDGMPDPSIYNYFSDFDSPLRQMPQKPAKSYPLYNQFGAYNG